MSLIHNERVKLTATLLNGIAIVSVAVGGIAPGVSVPTGSVNPSSAIVSSAICVLVGGSLQMVARSMLGRLKP